MKYITYFVTLIIAIITWKVIDFVTGDSGDIPLSFIVISVGVAIVATLPNRQEDDQEGDY